MRIERILKDGQVRLCAELFTASNHVVSMSNEVYYKNDGNWVMCSNTPSNKPFKSIENYLKHDRMELYKYVSHADILSINDELFQKYMRGF
ncbi:MAG: hypothetical protein ACRC3J_09165 [Culicoidibacterales bacterium]